MTTQYRYLIHKNGPALWPEHKPLTEVLELKDTTPENIFEATYQGNPTAPGGSTFKRDFFKDNRYDASDQGLINRCVARYVSWDTAMKAGVDNAYTAHVVGELWSDYRLAIRVVWRDRLEFPDLPDKIESFYKLYNRDEKLRGIIIEDKSSGTSAYQTLMKTADDNLKRLLVAFQPSGDKETRGGQAAVWCKNGSVLLPAPGPACPWIVDFEDELFTFPGSVFKDQVDAFSQLILWVENLLAEGHRLRSGGVIRS